MGNLFVFEGLVKPYILAVDSALLKSKGHVWHTSPYEGRNSLIQVLTQMQDGVSAIPEDGYLDTNLHDIKY